MEVITTDQRRRRWSVAERAELVRRTYEAGSSVSLVARQTGVSASQLFQWRKLERQGALTAVSAGEAVVPASELAAARAEIAKLQRVLGKKTLENEILKEAVEYAAGKKVDCALALVADGRRPVRVVYEALGVARSHVHALRGRPHAWQDGRKSRMPREDEALVGEIKAQIADLPSYRYRRACALVNRERKAASLPRVNAKRVYRVMAEHALLLPKAPKRTASSRRHDGTVAVTTSNTRWCSDGFEIKCDSGETVTATFVKDCCDREIMAWRAWAGKGLPGEPVKEMLIEAVERRFGSVEGVPSQRVEFLTDNGGAYIAADTRRIARSLGLEPINTPVCSPQSNGMAESFVNTFRRDYLSRMDLTDARTVMAQLPAAFEHFNEVHPHSSLQMRSPWEFRRELRDQRRLEIPALNCE
ncbi:IS3 family transposase [Roseateles depolymerans]|uniref:IS3 family transposase n=1 Tax=Roseateles depolymerans TaxID=76731 RepID=UPI0035C0E495